MNQFRFRLIRRNRIQRMSYFQSGTDMKIVDRAWDEGVVMGHKRNTGINRGRGSPAVSISHGNPFLLFEQQMHHPLWGRGAVGELTNCITGHYRCSVIDYLYPYKMSGSLVDQASLASSDKMSPLNHHTRANNTFKYIRELSDKVLCV